MCEDNILQLYIAKGIHHQRNSTQIPQQNRVVKRKNKHLN